ncbi:hypothetical protein RclHR1_05800004 [Rhizophagus clarus]|uniref:Kinase-like domain-containing protein n=1 Tax=Rhizophagus clarus TaxID=94130 RepID=A0A2Z6SGF6_9GLOM|nr:hypothetical protein RclHR1_05800004 [Rhizophagus clarus]GES88033.1 kinase-like domain-containing protein [Rhizophagus clarus]
MWEFTSGIPPFNDRAHDHLLIYDICKNECSEIIENTPRCYVDLMKRCWASNRPIIAELENEISETNKDGDHKYQVSDINGKLYNVMLEFIKAEQTKYSYYYTTSFTSMLYIQVATLLKF